MEAAGLALAILPLLINQLDSYVQGLETIKSFGAKRYRRELEGYSSSLGTQQAIFLNTLERALDGVVEYDDSLDELRNNPLGHMWKSRSLQSSLQEKLGRDFSPFHQTMTEIAGLLKELSRKLRLDKDASAVQNCDIDQSVLKKEVKKFRDIFSKSIYLDLFSRINTANTILKTLVEQSDYRGTMQKRRMSKRPLLRQRKARKSARSLHNAIMRRKYWNCSCMNQHSIQFVLHYPLEDANNATEEDPNGPRFQMILPFKGSKEVDSEYEEGLEIGAELEDTKLTDGNTGDPPPYTIEQGKSPPSKKTKVQFAVDKPSVPKPTHHKPSCPPIFDMCSALSAVSTKNAQNELIGFISDEIDCHNLYYVRNLSGLGDTQPQSLSEIITNSTDIFAVSSGQDFLFTWGHRLRVAVHLACSVLQFHGSWLKTRWSSRDIMFTKHLSGDIDKPYVLWKVEPELDVQTLCNEFHAFSLIQSEILFPLGLVLVELSLCHTIESLRIPDDEDKVEAYANLKTATRLLPIVGKQSGAEYENVVRRCLLWPGTKESTLDSEKMQEEIFQLVISPLVENLRSFEGRS